MIGSRSCVGGFIHFLCSNSILIMNIVFGKFLKLNRLSYRQLNNKVYSIWVSKKVFCLQTNSQNMHSWHDFLLCSKSQYNSSLSLWIIMDMIFHKLSSDWLTLTQDQQPTRTEQAPPMRMENWFLVTYTFFGLGMTSINLCRIMLL